MLLSDSHIHTMFSSDSEENPVNVVNNAISLGFKHICFTDHNDFDAPLEDGKVMFDLDFPEYIKYFQNLKESYKDKINIHIGVEQGLMRSVADRVNSYDSAKQLDFIIGSSHLVYGEDPYYPEFWEAYDSKKQLDFIIGSSHLVYGEDPYYPEFWEKRSAKDTVLTYYESILDNLGCCHNFDVYGHLDYIARYIPANSYTYNWHDFNDLICIILKTIIEQGKGIEINTAGLKYGMPEPNPCLDIVKIYHDLGGEIITVGSDAHEVKFFAYRFDVVADMLKNAGFNYYTIFNERKPEFIRL
ncbi:histidinol-phosphatase [Lachnospira eligens CAG:72]|uniref:Histidinol-phosphatase n=1 Tax=Lachnospira eligens CAG:72 TaxID=1263077 RepID=R6AES6_9FIRM|nr:histidinol-phosphatase [[Eubacterium] eligens CAG:72]